MFSFAIGIICVVALISTVRRHRYGYAHGWGYSHRPWHGWSSHPPGGAREPWRRTHWGAREALDLLIDRLGATREQEKLIREQARRFRSKLKSMRGEGRRTRDDLARALRADSFDENVMGDLFVRHDDELRELRIQTVELLANVHAVLDERQRELLASIVEDGRPLGFGGPYRSAW